MAYAARQPSRAESFFMAEKIGTGDAFRRPSFENGVSEKVKLLHSANVENNYLQATPQYAAVQDNLFGEYAFTTGELATIVAAYLLLTR